MRRNLVVLLLVMAGLVLWSSLSRNSARSQEGLFDTLSVGLHAMDAQYHLRMIPDSQSEGSNNADKLNAEITAMRTKGARPTGTIFFPDRVYGIGSTIVLPEVNGYKFEGCGLTYAVPFNQESSTGKLGPASILAATTSLDPMIQVGTRWTTLDDITLYGYWWDSGVSPPATRSAIGIQQIDGGSFPTGKLRGSVVLVGFDVGIQLEGTIATDTNMQLVDWEDCITCYQVLNQQAVQHFFDNWRVASQTQACEVVFDFNTGAHLRARNGSVNEACTILKTNFGSPHYGDFVVDTKVDNSVWTHDDQMVLLDMRHEETMRFTFSGDLSGGNYSDWQELLEDDPHYYGWNLVKLCGNSYELRDLRFDMFRADRVTRAFNWPRPTEEDDPECALYLVSNGTIDPTDGELWLDAIDEASVTGTDPITWTDGSGSGNTVSKATSNLPVETADAIHRGNAVFFNNGHWLAKASPTGLDNVSDLFVFAVFRQDNPNQQFDVIASIWDTNNVGCAWRLIIWNDDTIRFEVSQDGTDANKSVATGPVVVDDAAYAVCGFYDGSDGTANLIVDGKLYTGSALGAGNIFNSSEELRIGADSSASTSPFNGYIAHVSAFATDMRVDDTAKQGIRDMLDYLRSTYGAR